MSFKYRKLRFDVYKKFVFKFSKIDRLGISSNYIRGNGIEIGALNIPLLVTPDANVKYVDRISAKEHAAIFTDMPFEHMVHVDIIDDGETLKKIEDESQDFVIANHFIEHCQNPAMTIENLLRVLRKGGVVFLAIPDKRYTFDSERALTPMGHFIRDYKEGPEWSEESHYEEFVRKTEWSKNIKTDDDVKKTILRLKNMNYSIHFHVWSHPTMIDFFQLLRNELHFPFEIDLSVAARNGSIESIFILRKQ